jgi:hypothetical protein
MTDHHPAGRAATIVLSFYAALVGTALGSLLPRAASGATLGCAMALLVEVVLTGSLSVGGRGGMAFALAGPFAALVGGIITSR